MDAAADGLSGLPIQLDVVQRHLLIVVHAEDAVHNDDEKREEECAPESQQDRDDLAWLRTRSYVTIPYRSERDDGEPDGIEVLIERICALIPEKRYLEYSDEVRRRQHSAKE